VPESEIVLVDGVALLTIVTIPLAAPFAVGAKSVLKVVLDPAAIEIGRLKPATENPVPLAESCVIVSPAVPGLEMVTFCAEELPTAILPKATDAVESDTSGAEEELEPVEDPPDGDDEPLFELKGLVPPRPVSPRHPESPRDTIAMAHKPMKLKWLRAALA
jgi:hypothetical protein